MHKSPPDRKPLLAVLGSAMFVLLLAWVAYILLAPRAPRPLPVPVQFTEPAAVGPAAARLACSLGPERCIVTTATDLMERDAAWKEAIEEARGKLASARTENERLRRSERRLALSIAGLVDQLHSFGLEHDSLRSGGAYRCWSNDDLPGAIEYWNSNKAR